MNNNPDNLNINPESNNNFFNNQNGFVPNQPETLNVIPQIQPEILESNINQGIINSQNINIDNNISSQNNNYFNSNIDNEMTRASILNNEGITVFQEQNKFITENQTNTALNDLNVEGEYNGLTKIDYSKDPKVMENIQSQNKKNTITITGEAKVFLIIIAVLLLFTFVMPIIFDFINNIQH